MCSFFLTDFFPTNEWRGKSVARLGWGIREQEALSGYELKGPVRTGRGGVPWLVGGKALEDMSFLTVRTKDQNRVVSSHLLYPFKNMVVFLKALLHQS